MHFNLLDINSTIANKPHFERPWGYFVNLVDAGEFKTKVIVVNPLARLSLQKHFKRSEVWVGVSGKGIAVVDSIAYSMEPLSSVIIKKEEWHRLMNTSTDAVLVIYETQIGICDEEDIERKQDDYGRQ